MNRGIPAMSIPGSGKVRGEGESLPQLNRIPPPLPPMCLLLLGRLGYTVAEQGALPSCAGKDGAEGFPSFVASQETWALLQPGKVSSAPWGKLGEESWGITP